MFFNMLYFLYTFLINWCWFIYMVTEHNTTITGLLLTKYTFKLDIDIYI